MPSCPSPRDVQESHVERRSEKMEAAPTHRRRCRGHCCSSCRCSAPLIPQLQSSRPLSLPLPLLLLLRPNAHVHYPHPLFLQYPHVFHSRHRSSSMSRPQPSILVPFVFAFSVFLHPHSSPSSRPRAVSAIHALVSVPTDVPPFFLFPLSLPLSLSLCL